MADESNSDDTISTLTDLQEWLNASLCGCPIKKTEIIDENKESAEIVQDIDRSNVGESKFLENVWSDGRIFQWLVHSFRPEAISCPTSSINDSGEEIIQKVQQAFKIAEDEFGVQNLIVSGDFIKTDSSIKKEADALTLLTYLGQLRHALRNVESVCSTPRPANEQIHWPMIAEQSIYLRPIYDSPKCHDCRESVLILDRFLMNNIDVRHRRCFRCERCRKLLRIGLYRPTKTGNGYECLEHEKEDLMARLTPAPEDKKPKQSDDDGGRAKLAPTMYPELPKADDDGPLYPRLASPEEKAINDSSAGGSGVATSTVQQETNQSKEITKMENQLLSPPLVEARSRSSERDAPVPAPRKSVHTRGGSDISAGTISSSENVPPSALSPTDKSARPQRPVPPPKPKPDRSPVLMREETYPDELNPFDDEEETNNRHSTPVISDGPPKPDVDNRRSLAVAPPPPRPSVSPKPTMKKVADQPTSSSMTKSLNPFGSDSESEDDGKADENDDDDRSSLSSTNPFNESADESDNKGKGPGEDSKDAAKKLPPPRPPPPSKPSPSPLATTPKLGHKKRPAPPPPPPGQQQLLAPPTSGPPARPLSPKKKKRPAPPRPLPLKRQIRTETALSPEQLSSAFETSEKDLLEAEAAGGEFETNIRKSANEEGLAKVSSADVRQWIDLVQRKFDLIRKETEYVYMCRERQLDELHAEIEYQLRCIIEKPESEKTAEDIDREASLLQRMLDVIEEKSKLVDSQDEMIALGGTAFPRNSLQLDDSLLSSGSASKSSTLDKSNRSVKSGEEKQEKKKKKIKLRLKKLKQKIANSMSTYPVVPM